MEDKSDRRGPQVKMGRKVLGTPSHPILPFSHCDTLGGLGSYGQWESHCSWGPSPDCPYDLDSSPPWSHLLLELQRDSSPLGDEDPVSSTDPGQGGSGSLTACFLLSRLPWGWFCHIRPHHIPG